MRRRWDLLKIIRFFFLNRKKMNENGRGLTISSDTTKQHLATTSDSTKRLSTRIELIKSCSSTKIELIKTRSESETDSDEIFFDAEEFSSPKSR